MSTYDHLTIETKWREYWREHKTFATDVQDTSRPKWYNLVMFPYPSGDLHIGHWYNFAPADVIARYKRMHGHNVLNPIGFDAFGLPAENAAIKRNIHPSDWTKSNITNMIKQLETMGPSYDWDRVVDTSSPEYYKWTQWCFVQLYKKGLAYKKEAAANWCPNCKSVLANEQAEGGVCWRCGTKVEQRMINQWFFKITDYADELQSAVNTLNWPEKIKLMQKNWIGKSEGAQITFVIENTESSAEKHQVTVFSTRPETIMGATFIVLAPEHPLVNVICTSGQKREVEHYQSETKKKSEFERISQKEHKTGAFTGAYANHPITGEKLPIWIGDFVLPNYAQGAVMGVPAHDERDYDFAKAQDLHIKFIAIPAEVGSIVVNKSVDPEFFKELEQSGGFTLKPFSTWGTLILFEKERYRDYEIYAQRYISDGPWFIHTDGLVRTAIFKDKVVTADPDGSWNTAIEYGRNKKIIDSSLDFSFPEEGFAGPYTGKENTFLINSGQFSGLNLKEAAHKMMDYLSENGHAQRTIQYRLRDWLISRQRYWGPPVPIIYCESCGVLPVPEKELPVILPYDVDYTPKETSPLGSSPEFVNTTCPQCNSPAKRDTDTLDTFVDSSWYFLRFLDPHNADAPFPDQNILNHWMPVDMYIGGAEHAVLHLLYARFIVKVFRDMGYLTADEPFQSLCNQGTILGPDHQKMSKSKGNVIAPDELVMHYGADTVRVYLCFLGPYDQGGPWNPSGIEGASRFVRRLYSLLTREDNISSETSSDRINVALHRLIKKVTEDIPVMKFNTAIAAFMEFVNAAQDATLTQEQKKVITKLIAPFCPFLAEDIWHTQFHKPEASSIHHEEWPEYNPGILVEHEVEVVVQVNSKVRGHIIVPRDANQEQAIHAAMTLPKVVEHLTDKEIKKTIFVPHKIINFIT